MRGEKIDSRVKISTLTRMTKKKKKKKGKMQERGTSPCRGCFISGNLLLQSVSNDQETDNNQCSPPRWHQGRMYRVTGAGEDSFRHLQKL